MPVKLVGSLPGNAISDPVNLYAATTHLSQLTPIQHRQNPV